MLKETLLKFLKMDSLIENITGYVEARIGLMKIEIKEEVAKALAKALVLVSVLAVLLLSVFLISMAVAYKIGERVGAFGGFAIVGSIYLVIGVTIFFLRHPITNYVEARLDQKMKNKKSSDGTA